MATTEGDLEKIYHENGENANQVESLEAEWTIINQEEEFESVLMGLQESGMGEVILADSMPCSPEKPPSPTQDPQELLIQELESQIRLLNCSLEEERNLRQSQTLSLTEEIKNLRRDHEICENENRALRKERDFWQKKSMESTEGMRVQDDVLIAAFHSLKSRILHLSNEARSCRLLEENGGIMKDLSSNSLSEDIPDLTNVGSVDSNLEETLTALIELENELIPLVSKIHSSYSQSQTALDAPKVPKISLTSFQENDLALFFPTPKGDYLAFNCGAPHHYLSAESKALIGQDKHFRKIYVLGRIIYKEEKIATVGDSPYHLAPGIKYYEVSVASVTAQLS